MKTKTLLGRHLSKIQIGALVLLVVALSYRVFDQAVSLDYALQGAELKERSLGTLVELTSILLVGTSRHSIEAAIKSRRLAQTTSATEEMLTVEDIAFRFEDGVLVEVRLWSELPEELLD